MDSSVVPCSGSDQTPSSRCSCDPIVLLPLWFTVTFIVWTYCQQLCPVCWKQMFQTAWKWVRSDMRIINLLLHLWEARVVSALCNSAACKSQINWWYVPFRHTDSLHLQRNMLLCSLIICHVLMFSVPCTQVNHLKYTDTSPSPKVIQIFQTTVSNAVHRAKN